MSPRPARAEDAADSARKGRPGAASCPAANRAGGEDFRCRSGFKKKKGEPARARRTEGRVARKLPAAVAPVREVFKSGDWSKRERGGVGAAFHLEFGTGP